MTTKDDNSGFMRVDEVLARRRIAIMHIHHIPEANYTEMIDEPKLAHNDPKNDINDGADSGHQIIDSPD
jgi:hypothetical protein